MQVSCDVAVYGGRVLYRRVSNAVSYLLSSLCLAASKIGHIFLDYCPFAINIMLIGPGLLISGSYGILFTVLLIILMSYFIPSYRKSLISSVKRTISILRTLIQFQYRIVLMCVNGRMVRQAVETGGALTSAGGPVPSSHSASSWFESNIDPALDGMMIGSIDLQVVLSGIPVSGKAGSIVLADGRILTGRSDGSLQISDLRTQESILFQAHTFSVQSVLQLRDGRVVSQSNIMGGWKYMKIWDIDTLTCLKTIEFDNSGLFIELSQELSDGTILKLAKDFSTVVLLYRVLISIWDLEWGMCVSRFELGEEYGAIDCHCEILQLRSSDEQLLCCSGWQSNILTIVVRTLRLSMEERYRLVGHSAGVRCVLQLEDGRLVSGSLDRTVKVWDIPSGRCLVTLDHPSGLHCLAPLRDHPSSQRIVSACEDGSLRIWDTTTYSCLSVHFMGILVSRFDNFISLSDGRFLCAHISSQSLSLWSLDSSEQQYLSTTFASKVNIDVEMKPVIQQHGHGRPFSAEGVLIYNRVYSVGSPPEIVPERICLWSFPSVQKRRWLRRRGFLLLVHCSYRAVRSNVTSSNSLVSSPAFQKLIRIHSLVMVIAKLL